MPANTPHGANFRAVPSSTSPALPVGSFDLTFDHTFQGVILATPTVDSCRAPGAYLTWHSPTGWPHWLFEGPIQTAKVVTSRGVRQQGGVTKHNQKESALLLTCHTSGLSTAQAEAIGTIYESVAVFLVVPDDAGKFVHVEVSLEPGTFDLHTTESHTHSLSVRFALPARRSARS